MKATGIVIHTVGAGVTTASKPLLQGCATTTSQYYDDNATGSNLDAAFSAIAGSIQNLRISNKFALAWRYRSAPKLAA